MRARIAALLGGAIIVAACGSPATTPSGSPDASPTSAASAAATASTPPTAAAPSASPAPSAAGPWQDAGTMTLGRRTTHALLLGDGRVLVVGNDDFECVRDDSVRSDIWDPATGSWSAGPSLPKPRGWFAAATPDGGALVAGGANAGTLDHGWQQGNAAYSSTYVYRPADAADGWAKSGLLASARIAPAAATLLDGRVLVAGGYYASGGTARSPEFETGITLAAFQPGDRGRSVVPDPGDVDPGPFMPALATAELYDPATDTWSATGPLRYARIHAQAVTLADGRVLVVGSVTRPDVYAWTRVDDRAVDSAEVYDPATGRFTLTGELPALDWTPLMTLGSSSGVDSFQPLAAAGTLVALEGGGALLVGRTYEAYTTAGDYEGRIVRTLRFDPASATWTEIDRWVVGHKSAGVTPDLWHVLVEGHPDQGAMAVSLADGTILVAGGIDPVIGDVSDAAWRYEPGSGTWTKLPAMPAPRAWGTAVALPDGSALLLAGRGGVSEPSHCGTGESGLATTLRYVP